MKKENLLALIKELAKTDKLHKEYIDNNIHYVIDAKRENDVLNFTVEFKKDDKKEFEQWVDQLDDDIFNEIWESLSRENDLHSLNEIYESDNYKEVIDKFKEKAKIIAKNKIEYLIKQFNLI